jgi:S1-C subfamily serine protease
VTIFFHCGKILLGDIMKKSVISFLLGVMLTISVGAYAVPAMKSAKYTNDGFKYNGTTYPMRIAALQAEGDKWPSTYISIKDMAAILGGRAYGDGQNICIEAYTDLETVAKNCKDSCVMIYAYKGDKITQGSGWVYKGYVITARHVIEGATKIDVFTDDSLYGIPGTIHYVDTEIDVAVLKSDTGMPSVALGDSDKLVEGQKLIGIHSPKGTQNMIDECVYSGYSEYDDRGYMMISENSLDFGSSGGAIFDSAGNVIGMVVKDSMAIPINELKSILN